MCSGTMLPCLDLFFTDITMVSTEQRPVSQPGVAAERLPLMPWILATVFSYVFWLEGNTGFKCVDS